MHLRLLLPIICFMVMLCNCLPQETPHATQGLSVISITPGINGSQGSQTCGPCYVVAGFTEKTPANDATDFTFGPTGLITSPIVVLVFTAYSVTSTVMVAGQCTAVKGPPESVNPYSITLSAGTGQDATSSAEMAFINSVVGVPTCIPSGENPVQQTIQPIQTISPSMTVIGTFSSASQTTSVSAANSTLVISTTLPLQSLTVPPSTVSTITPSSTLNQTFTGLSTGSKVGIGIAVPVGTITLSMLGIYLWRKDRRQRQTAQQETFVRQKTELDAEQRRHEMEANERRHELEEGAGRHELEADNRRQELKGEDHSRELEVPE